MTTTQSNSPSDLAITAFKSEFGMAPIAIARAPGRVNVIGEHVDYNDGFVLPAALELDACLAFSPRQDGRVRVHAVTYGETEEFGLTNMKGQGRKSWIDYIAGPAYVLQRRGHALQGFNAALASNVPVASGLSSSAAIEVASMCTFLAVADLELTGVEIAKVAQQAENEYVGVSCGIMDQFISTLGRARNLLLIDCLSLAYEQIPIPDTVSLVIADTSASRSLAGSAYNKRVAECREGLAGLAGRWPEITSWRDVEWDQVTGPSSPLTGTPLLRAKHVVGEISRTLESASLLKKGNVEGVGKLMRESHASLRNNYEVSSLALDTMVEIMDSHPGCLGARLTGAGFGGCAVALVEAGTEAGLIDLIRDQFPKQTSLQPQVYASGTGNGADVTYK